MVESRAVRRPAQLTVLTSLLGALVVVNSLVRTAHAGWSRPAGRPDRPWRDSDAVRRRAVRRGLLVDWCGQSRSGPGNADLRASGPGSHRAVVPGRGSVASAVLAGVLGFFTYYYVSAVFGTAQNRLFRCMLAAASLAAFTLTVVASRLKVGDIAASLPGRPGRRALATYLLAVAAALTSPGCRQ